MNVSGLALCAGPWWVLGWPLMGMFVRGGDCLFRSALGTAMLLPASLGPAVLCSSRWNRTLLSALRPAFAISEIWAGTASSLNAHQGFPTIVFFLWTDFYYILACFLFFFPASFPSVFMRQVMRVSVLSCHLWWKHFSVLPLSLTLFTVFFLVLEDFMFSGAHHIDIWTVSASVDMLRNISSNSKFI